MVVSDGLKNILPGHAICSEACSMWRVTRCQSFTMLTGLSQVFQFTASSTVMLERRTVMLYEQFTDPSGSKHRQR